MAPQVHFWDLEVAENPTAAARINAAQSRPHHRGEQSENVFQVELFGDVDNIHQD